MYTIGAWIMSFGYKSKSFPKNGELQDAWFILGLGNLSFL